MNSATCKCAGLTTYLFAIGFMIQFHFQLHVDLSLLSYYVLVIAGAGFNASIEGNIRPLHCNAVVVYLSNNKFDHNSASFFRELKHDKILGLKLTLLYSSHA